MQKAYRFEKLNRKITHSNVASEEVEHGGYQKILEELTTLKQFICTDTPDVANSVVDEEAMETQRAEINEAFKLKAELDRIYVAIAETKREIAGLQVAGITEDQANGVTDELDAVVVGTEQATESILSAGEVIDQNASALSAMLPSDSAGLANDISEEVVKIFEACNFQDLTGQRISKVISVLRFIEERTESMIEIWGGLESFKHVDAMKPEEATGDMALLNGPSFENDEGVADQDDIDALFA